MRWLVSTLEQGFLLTVSLTEWTVLARYTASAHLTPKKHRAKVSRLKQSGHGVRGCDDGCCFRLVGLSGG